MNREHVLTVAVVAFAAAFLTYAVKGFFLAAL